MTPTHMSWIIKSNLIRTDHISSTNWAIVPHYLPTCSIMAQRIVLEATLKSSLHSQYHEECINECLTDLDTNSLLLVISMFEPGPKDVVSDKD